MQCGNEGSSAQIYSHGAFLSYVHLVENHLDLLQ